MWVSIDRQYVGPEVHSPLDRNHLSRIRILNQLFKVWIRIQHKMALIRIRIQIRIRTSLIPTLLCYLDWENEIVSDCKLWLITLVWLSLQSQLHLATFKII